MIFKTNILEKIAHRTSASIATNFAVAVAALALLIFMGSEPLTWDEILYMQSSYVGQQDGIILLRIFHTGVLSLFMKLIPDPLLATRVFWAVLAGATLGLPIAYAFRTIEAGIRSRLVFLVLYIALALSADFFWWTPGLAYPDYTVAALMAVMLWICMTQPPELSRTFSWVGMLLVFAFSAKETGLVLLPCALLLLLRLPSGTVTRQALQSILLHTSYGGVVAFALLLFVGYFVLGVTFERLPTMIAEWRHLNFGRTQLDNSTFIAWGFRAENPGFFVSVLVLLIIAMIWQDRTLAILGAVALFIIALLSFTNIYSTATISGRYLMPLLPVAGFMLARVVSTSRDFVNDRSTTVLIGVVVAFAVWSMRWPMAVIPRTTILLNSALIILLGCTIIAMFLPRVARATMVACLFVICFAPNSASFIASAIGNNKAAAAGRFADLKTLAAQLPVKDNAGTVYFHPSFYKDLQLERGEWPLGAMLNFYTRKVIYPQRVIKPAAGMPASPRYVFVDSGEALPAEWLLMSRSGKSALYVRTN